MPASHLAPYVMGVLGIKSATFHWKSVHGQMPKLNRPYFWAKHSYGETEPIAQWMKLENVTRVCGQSL